MMAEHSFRDHNRIVHCGVNMVTAAAKLDLDIGVYGNESPFKPASSGY